MSIAHDRIVGDVGHRAPCLNGSSQLVVQNHGDRMPPIPGEQSLPNDLS